MAISAKIKKKNHRIVVVTGDGEINEGSIWEAALSASKHKLNNLIWIIDYNKLQSYGKTEEVLNLEPLKKKIKSFGFNVKNTDGHNKEKIKKCLNKISNEKSKPNAIICHTIKGKGFKFAEQNPHWHHKSKLSKEEILLMYESLNIGN